MEDYKIFPEDYQENANPNEMDVLMSAKSEGDDSVLSLMLSRVRNLFTGRFVSNERAINNKQLTADITLDYTDVGATRAGYDTVGTNLDDSNLLRAFAYMEYIDLTSGRFLRDFLVLYCYECNIYLPSGEEIVYFSGIIRIFSNNDGVMANYFGKNYYSGEVVSGIEKLN